MSKNWIESRYDTNKVSDCGGNEVNYDVVNSKKKLKFLLSACVETDALNL
jgi:hypothetical protein